MTADRLSQEEHTEALRQAQSLQETVNAAIGHRLVRCVAPLRLIRPRNVSSPDQGTRYGVELRIEPLVTIEDFREQPARRIAAVEFMQFLTWCKGRFAPMTAIHRKLVTVDYFSIIRSWLSFPRHVLAYGSSHN
jgi:hypothetical protein